MARWRGTTTERGYGHPHTAERQRRLALYKPGDPCAHGGEPLNYPPPTLVTDRHGTRLVSPWLDLPHTTDRSGYLPGLACRKHNRADGAHRRNQLYTRDGRPRRRPVPATPPPHGEHGQCQYCGKPSGTTTPNLCAAALCQVAHRQAARLAATDGLTMTQATEQMTAKVRRALSAR